LKFGAVSVAEANGAILAHGLRLSDRALKKGHVIGPDDQAALRAAGVGFVIAAQIELGDVGEDLAAERLAESLAGENLRRERPFTGRVNIFATVGGLAMVDAEAIARINRVDEAITVATLAAHRRVAAGDMAATVKIIPFAAPGAALSAACESVPSRGAVWVAPFRPLRLPGLKASVIAKTLRVLEARLEPSGATIAREERVAHEEGSLAAAIERLAPHSEALVIFGASAITDRRDVIPRAIEASGGRIEHFGMPVDPGNLLLLAERAGKPIIGAPGCARSPKENGFDWVLDRILADVPITSADIKAMGVGGLLMEIASRPQPRLGDD
jgi:molybdenum cofactor cytidylyltransferase